VEKEKPTRKDIPALRKNAVTLQKDPQLGREGVNPAKRGCPEGTRDDPHLVTELGVSLRKSTPSKGGESSYLKGEGGSLSL